MGPKARVSAQPAFDSRLTPLFVLVVSLLVSCGDAGALDGLPQGREGRVTAVLAGDVIELDGKEPVKLAGISAPRGEEPYATASRQALQTLIGGRQVALFFGGARKDKFGRTLAQVEDADSRRWIEGAMLDTGAARVRTYPDDRIPAGAMLAREAVARRAGRGLWTIPEYEVRLPDEVGRGDEGFMVVEGRAQHVGEGRQDLYVDFSDDWRNTVSIVIPREALRMLRTAGVDPFDLQGRMIRVRGVVTAGRLLVNHPEQIEILRG